MSDFKIDKKIPLPNSISRNNYPFSEMEVGDSFEVGPEDINRIRPAATWYGKRHKMKFAVRHYAGAFRCWRLE